MTDEFSPLPFLPNDDDQETRAVDSTRKLDQRTPPRGIPPVVNRPNVTPPPPPKSSPKQIPPPPRQTGQSPRVPPQNPPPPQQKRGRARNRRDSGLYLPLWSLGAMLLIVFLIAGCIILVVIGLGGRNAQIPPAPPPQMVVNTLIPTNTPENQPLTPATATIPAIFEPVVGNGQPNISFSLAGPTLMPIEISPTPQPLGVGVTVMVVGVGETQLNVRDNAGVIGTNILFRADEGTTFVIVAGPELVDNLTWWRIQNPNDATQSGWAAGQYLQVTP